MPETSAPVDVVLGWIAAVNAGDTERALALTTPDVTIIREHVSGHGRDVLRAWLEHAAPAFETRAVNARDDAVVVAQRGAWRDLASGEVRVEGAMAIRFRVVAGEIAEMQRYADVEGALGEAGLTREDARDDDTG